VLRSHHGEDVAENDSDEGKAQRISIPYFEVCVVTLVPDVWLWPPLPTPEIHKSREVLGACRSTQPP
jgi:hypothetical protein